MPEPARERAKPSGSEPGDDRGSGGDEPQEPTPPDAPIVPVIRPNDAEVDFGWSGDPNSDESEAFDFKAYARPPLPHQVEAVEWLINKHAKRAVLRRKQPATNDEEGSDAGKRPSRTGAGALLADDMGLGKTFTTLIFLKEWFALWRRNFDGEPPAVLIVAPLSLLENWRVEIAKSYGETNVFKRVLVAQSDSDLWQVMRRPGGRDRAVPGEVLEYGLGYGDGTERSIDMPGGCVLTTYQTLRDYRFSFAKAEWSAVVFDEAQNIKNPNAQQTIAAKSLKAVFWLALTGTPVENHLGDFWSILDTVEPGPHLGSFAEFRRNWIVRMANAAERMTEIGEELRQHIGPLMLRRMKEKVLAGLPEKAGHDQAIPTAMKPEQVARYDSVIASANQQDAPEEAGDGRHNSHLAALWKIRQISLHPDLMADGSIPNARSAAEARSVLCRSGKLEWLLFELDRIKGLGEKALVFCVQKKLQTALAHHLSLIYGGIVPVVNGDTKTASSRRPDETRLGLIQEFSNRTGFAVCVLSPIAAGAGLNIVAANHVIHLERHWNPAKEDQATDRVYRIGQTKPVRVYLPVSRHPNSERRAFDEVLHGLIGKKRGLQGALGLVPSQSVSDLELINEVFTSSNLNTQAKLLGLDEAINLPWRLFEALIAVLYKRNAESVILTPGGSDHGCDVVVRGWGENRENLLIQCKQTSSNKLDSEVAVREVEGARPFYENALNVTFGRRCLHTTARRFSRRTKRAAELCRVSTHDRSWLANELKQNPVTLAEVLVQNARRQRV
jgi:superfamily II DNA or RNA helicase